MKRKTRSSHPETENHSNLQTHDFFISIVDGYNQRNADDVLSEILKNVPHKPMKSLEHGPPSHAINQYPIPDDPPPFKPLTQYNAPYEQYGLPPDSPSSLHSYTSDHFSDYSHQKSVAVNPKAYDAYHTMMLKETSRHKTKEQRQQSTNFVTLPPTHHHAILGDLVPNDGLEIQKSIQYEIKL